MGSSKSVVNFSNSIWPIKRRFRAYSKYTALKVSKVHDYLFCHFFLEYTGPEGIPKIIRIFMKYFYQQIFLSTCSGTVQKWTESRLWKQMIRVLNSSFPIYWTCNNGQIARKIKWENVYKTLGPICGDTKCLSNMLLIT